MNPCKFWMHVVLCTKKGCIRQLMVMRSIGTSVAFVGWIHVILREMGWTWKFLCVWREILYIPFCGTWVSPLWRRGIFSFPRGSSLLEVLGMYAQTTASWFGLSYLNCIGVEWHFPMFLCDGEVRLFWLIYWWYINLVYLVVDLYHLISAGFAIERNADLFIILIALQIVNFFS